MHKSIAKDGTRNKTQVMKNEKPPKPKKYPLRKNSLCIQEVQRSTAQSSNTRGKCHVCSEDHYITSCTKFRDSTPESRHSIVKENDLCFSCLGASHRINDCYSTKRCKKCGRKHHTFLHRESSPISSSSAQPSAVPPVVEIKLAQPSKTPAYYASVPFTALGVAHAGYQRQQVRAQELECL